MGSTGLAGAVTARPMLFKAEGANGNALSMPCARRIETRHPRLSGSLVALITPFRHGAVDEVAFQHFVD